MKSKRTTLSLALVLAIVGALAVGAAPVAADVPPEEPPDGTIADGSTIEVTEASSENYSSVPIDTPASANASLDLSIEVADRGLEVYNGDSEGPDYYLQQKNASGADLHVFFISHDEFADVPVGANESVTLRYSVTATAENGSKVSASVPEGGGGGPDPQMMAMDTSSSPSATGTFTLKNGWERSVINLDPAALDGNVSGLDVESTESDSFWTDLPVIGTNATSSYDASSESAIDGTNTTVYVYMGDSGVAEEFESASDAGILSGTLRGWMSSLEAPGISSLGSSLAPSTDAESGDRTFGMTAAAGGEAVPVFINSADSDIVNDSETYAVYDADNNRIEVHPGEDYENESSINVRTASMEPEDVLGFDSLSSSMTENLNTREFIEAFGVQSWASNALGGLGILFVGSNMMLVGYFTIRREDREAALEA